MSGKTAIEMDLPDSFWKSRAERSEMQNRELVAEIKIRDGIISELQERLLELGEEPSNSIGEFKA